MSARNQGRLAQIIIIAMLAGIGGCAPTTTIQGDTDLQRLASAGQWRAITEASVRCSDRTEACAKQHAIKGDACLRLVIQQPVSASADEKNTRKLLDCAEDAYRRALATSPSKSASSRISYHGGLLLTLSERRNRLDAFTKERKLDRENEKLLLAAQDTRREVPDSGLGYLYGASAYVYRASLKPEGRPRCDDLRQAERLLRRSPPQSRQLVDEERRISALVKRELRESRCAPIRRR